MHLWPSRMQLLVGKDQKRYLHRRFRFAAMNLWFDGQESDLSVEIDIHEEEKGRLKLTITNIHVM